jgi:hypothetical protein
VKLEILSSVMLPMRKNNQRIRSRQETHMCVEPIYSTIDLSLQHEKLDIYIEVRN